MAKALAIAKAREICQCVLLPRENSLLSYKSMYFYIHSFHSVAPSLAQSPRTLLICIILNTEDYGGWETFQSALLMFKII